VFESCRLAAAELKMKVDRKEDDGPIGGCGGENSEGQKRRLAGIESVGELEPSYPLIGLVYQMSEDGQLRYIRWEQATKRDQELMGVKVGPVWAPDSSGIVKEVIAQEVLKASILTSSFGSSLKRRGLPIDQARLVDFDKFER